MHVFCHEAGTTAKLLICFNVAVEILLPIVLIIIYRGVPCHSKVDFLILGCVVCVRILLPAFIRHPIRLDPDLNFVGAQII